MPPENGYGNGKIHFYGTWAWRGVLVILLTVLWWNWTEMYAEVHQNIPAQIEKLDDAKVSKTRFDDFCERLKSIESKIDRLMRYQIRNNSPPEPK